MAKELKDLQCPVCTLRRFERGRKGRIACGACGSECEIMKDGELRIVSRRVPAATTT